MTLTETLARFYSGRGMSTSAGAKLGTSIFGVNYGPLFSPRNRSVRDFRPANTQAAAAAGGGGGGGGGAAPAGAPSAGGQPAAPDPGPGRTAPGGPFEA